MKMVFGFLAILAISLLANAQSNSNNGQCFNIKANACAQTASICDGACEKSFLPSERSSDAYKACRNQCVTEQKSCTARATADCK